MAKRKLLKEKSPIKLRSKKLANGNSSLYLSKLLGHKKVATTQIYADVLEKTKQKTMDLLNSFEESDNLMK